jgi:two-component system NtrC family sensor kinase
VVTKAPEARPAQKDSPDRRATQTGRGDVRRLWHRLDLRLFLLAAVVLLLITGSYDLFRFQRARREFLAQREREVSVLSQAVEGPYLIWRQQGERRALERVLQDIREAKEAVCVGIYGTEGKLAVEASASQASGGSESCPKTLAAATPPGRLLGPLSPLGTVRFQAPLSDRAGEQVGTFELILPASLIADPLRSQRTALITERLLILAAFGLTLWLALVHFVTRPIRRLIRQAEEVGRGNLGARLEVSTRTEIGDLARAFNRMAASLEESQERRMALERQVRHADKLAVMGKLASELAHEVGTPLNVISGRARVLQRAFPEGNPQRQGLEIIRSQVDRISRVIRRFLDVGRPPGAQQEWVQVGGVLAEAATFVEPELQKKRIHLRLAVPSDLPRLKVTPDGLFQVVLNLIMNAAAAVPRGGEIEVVAAPGARPPEAGEATPDPTGIEIQVRDDGHGLDPAIQAHVFEPFVSTRPGEGTGLGLSICRDIVRDHGGWIGIESRPGEGTTVRFWLPLDSQEVPHASASHPDHR